MPSSNVCVAPDCSNQSNYLLLVADPAQECLVTICRSHREKITDYPLEPLAIVEKEIVL